MTKDERMIKLVKLGENLTQEEYEYIRKNYQLFKNFKFVKKRRTIGKWRMLI